MCEMRLLNWSTIRKPDADWAHWLDKPESELEPLARSNRLTWAGSTTGHAQVEQIWSNPNIQRSRHSTSIFQYWLFNWTIMSHLTRRDSTWCASVCSILTFIVDEHWLLVLGIAPLVGSTKTRIKPDSLDSFIESNSRRNNTTTSAHIQQWISDSEIER